MNKQLALFLSTFCLIVLGVVAWQTAGASQGGGLSLNWYTMDGGGGTSQGGNYALSGTVGQFDAGSLSGGSYTVQGGYWQEEGFLAEAIELFLPVILKQ